MTTPLLPTEALGLDGHWYVACPASQVGASPLPVRVAELAFSVRRDESGALVGSAGAPPLHEADAYVWAYFGAEAPSAPPARLATLERRGYVYEQRTVRLAADWRLALENAFDFAHSAFVHPFVQPSWFLHRLGRVPTLEARYRTTSDGVTVDARLGRWRIFRHEFALPDRLRLVMLPDSPWPVDIVAFHVPEGPGLTRMEVLFGRPRWFWERPGVSFRPDVLAVMEQDRLIVEAQERLRRLDPAPPEEHCAADAYTLLARRMIAAAIAGRPLPDEPERTVRIRV